jgi:tRNA(Ser,Leu) C12 N-acetylase TAN1
MTEQKKESKPRATRVYIVIDRETTKPLALIDTVTEPAARKHHSNKTVEVRLASQKDMFDAAKAGVEIETAENCE